MSSGDKETTIVAFCCIYCAYAAADLAGSMRLQYPSNVRIIRTPCTGRLEVEYFLRAFENGADGVLVAGCEEGSCHFKEGNLIARRRVDYARKLLAESGLEADRLKMVNVSAAMARLFTGHVREMAETVQKLGPSPLNRAKTRVQQEIKP
jgi:coenzyme F420-reducing hydrogenase delta subunit